MPEPERDWRKTAAELIDAADPHRNPRPVYLLDETEAEGLTTWEPTWWAFTSPILYCELYEAIPRPRGYGFTAVICHPDARTEDTLPGTILHEYAHYIADKFYQATRPMLTCPADQLTAEMGRFYVAAIDAASGNVPWVDHGDHGAAFIRIACHLAYRTWKLWPGDLLDIIHRDYGLSTLAYRSVLGHEPQARQSEPLAAIAASLAPPEFQEFAVWDAERARASRRAITPESSA